MKLPSEADVALQDDVEYFIDIALQLFLAIERQTRAIELSLETAQNQCDERSAWTEFKERLICAASGLSTSVSETADRLENQHRTANIRCDVHNVSFCGAGKTREISGKQ
jgi:hypothetical protein